MRSTAGFLLVVFLSVPLRAQAPGDQLDEALAKIRASRSDLRIRADRYETRMKLKFVEGLLEDPALAEEKLRAASKDVWAASTSTGLVRQSADMLGVEFTFMGLLRAGFDEPLRKAPIPHEVKRALAGMTVCLSEARKNLLEAFAPLTPEERRRAVELVRAYVTNADARPTPSDFDLMSRFDLSALHSAAFMAAQSVEESLPALSAYAGKLDVPRLRLPSDAGDILLSGRGDDEYSEDDLRGVALLVDFGGRSRYHAPPAAAAEGQIRVVLDFSKDVTVDPSTSPSAGAGVFGVGLMYLPNPEGLKTIAAGDLSLGAGLFGVGGLFIEGRAELAGGRFTQGAGAFGAGLLRSRGPNSRYALRLSGQGFAFTRGFGLLVHRGDGARFDGGQTEPDPREALAALSMSQGVGYGPRAYAAGGAGLALVEGDGCELKASYLAQGQGYWHSLGALFLRSSRSRLQARRYAQGVGVHSAFGALLLDGNDNHLVTWGAGPALGWDYGVGLLAAQGDRNHFSSEWASARGDVNGEGLLFVRGSGNRLSLADAGSGPFKREAPSYGVVVLSGRENRVRDPAAGDPWGIIDGRDVFVDSGPVETAQWPAVDRSAAFLDERGRLQGLL